MHLFLMIESSKGQWQDIEEWIHSLELGEERDHPCLREVRLYDVVLNEKNKDTFIEKIKKHLFMKGERDLNKIKTFQKLLSKFTPLKQINIDHITEEELDSFSKKRSKGRYMKIIPIGYVEDRKNKNGIDLK